MEKKSDEHSSDKKSGEKSKEEIKHDESLKEVEQEISGPTRSMIVPTSLQFAVPGNIWNY